MSERLEEISVAAAQHMDEILARITPIALIAAARADNAYVDGFTIVEANEKAPTAIPAII